MKQLHVVIYSGGMDSLTLLHQVMVEAREKDQSLLALSFNYGQRHVKELYYAKAFCESAEIRHRIVDVAFLAPLLHGSSQTDDRVDVPEGGYAEPSMKLTVVPGRNSIMLAMALGIAEAELGQAPEDKAYIYYGAHAGDHHIYPDCRPAYIQAMRHAFLCATDQRVLLMAPYMNMTKGDIVTQGRRFHVNYAESWTCYKGGAEPCGKCGSCDERRDAFAYAGIPDPALA